MNRVVIAVSRPACRNTHQRAVALWAVAGVPTQLDEGGLYHARRQLLGSFLSLLPLLHGTIYRFVEQIAVSTQGRSFPACL